MSLGRIPAVLGDVTYWEKSRWSRSVYGTIVRMGGNQHGVRSISHITQEPPSKEPGWHYDCFHVDCSCSLCFLFWVVYTDTICNDGGVV